MQNTGKTRHEVLREEGWSDCVWCDEFVAPYDGGYESDFEKRRVFVCNNCFEQWDKSDTSVRRELKKSPLILRPTGKLGKSENVQIISKEDQKVNCLLCNEKTSGSIGAAGIFWNNLCQICKDKEDSIPKLMMEIHSKTMQKLDDWIGGKNG